MKLDKNHLNTASVFQHYLAFGGDVAKTAVTLDLDESQVSALAKAEKWHTKLDALNALGPGTKEVQIQINRAVNFVQAHRLRGLVDRVTGHLLSMDDERLMSVLSNSGKNGNSFSARSLTDLVHAADVTQVMTARALGDTAAERPAEESSGKSSIAMSVMAAMNAAEMSGLDSAKLIREQLEGVADASRGAITPSA